MSDDNLSCNAKINIFSALSTTQETSTRGEVSVETCERQPDIVIFPGNFSGCFGLNTTTKLQYHTSHPKIIGFPVTFEGPGLNCNPATGIQLYVVSMNGSSTRCNPWSDLLSNGVVRCTYRCKCADVCSLLEAYIVDRYPATVCRIIA